MTLCLNLVLLGFGPILGQAPNETIRVVFLGDTGTGKKGQKGVRYEILETAERVEIDRIFMAGDNIYKNGKPKHFGEKFLDIYDPLFEQGIQFHAALGNHAVQRCDAAPSNNDPFPRDATAYRNNPNKCWADQHLALPQFGYVNSFRYYSIAIGGTGVPLAEVFVLDSNTLDSSQTKLKSKNSDQAQLDWLVEALGGSLAHWRIVMLHHPIYTPRADRLFGHRSELKMRQQLEQLLIGGHVDAVIQGHNHFYARLKPQQGVRYFVTGSGGAGAYGFKPDGMTIDRPDQGKFNHFMLVDLSLEKFRYCSIDLEGRVRDGGWFAKGDPQDTPYAPGSCPIRE